MLASSASASFGFQAGSVESLALSPSGGPAVQAGSHLFDQTTGLKFNLVTSEISGEQIPDGSVKDIEVRLPVGLIGNPTATPRCSIALFNTPNPKEAFGLSGSSCPDDSQIGVAQVEITPSGEGAPVPLTLGLYNLVPPPSVPAEFGVNPIGIPIVLMPRIRTGEDYGVTVVSKNDNQTLRVFGVKATIWGLPSSSRHDGERGECLGALGETYRLGPEHPCKVETGGTPFLRLPTSCSNEPLTTTIAADSWEHPVASVELEGVREVVLNHDSEGRPTGVSGCDRVPFSPTVDVHTDTATAGAPTGATVEVSLPQDENPNGLGESDLRKAEVLLPVGMSASPAAATGLQGCTDTPEPAHDGKPARPEGEIALHSTEPVECPDASKVGTVEIETPLLEEPLEGSVYLARPYENKFESLLALYVVAEGSGVVIKLAGKVSADENTGQLKTVFEENPQAPFRHLRVKLFGGPRAALMTPRRCGAYALTGALTPWSSELPVPFSAPITVGSNCGGGFAPSMVAGTVSNQAAGFSPLTLTLSRSDQDQGFVRLNVRTPPGLLGMLSKVQVCEEPLIAQHACPAASQIGHVSVAAGAGPEPIYLPEPGHLEDPVYLTSGYNGAPFGLLTLVHAEAGPFNLGVVAVRSTINVDRRTSRVVATTGPIPTIVQGVPVDVRAINLLLDREGFIFNPTDCEPLQFEGSVLGDEGASAAISSRFQAADCANLGFKPSFKAATGGRSSKANGASLEVKIGYPVGPQANIAAAKVQLPKQMPSRLTTIQKACPEAIFAANPATCPVGSLVGVATATTPVLNVPVTGPAYLVSHGGAAFPDLVMILQGQGVTVELVGNTDIKGGITTSTFASVPDVPVSSFDVKLPTGPHSALTSNLPAKRRGNFCGIALSMPTTLVAQNGMRLSQTTKISITGCPRAKKPKKARKARRRP